MEIHAGAPSRPAPAVRARLTGLRRWNVAMGALHLAQGAAMLALASAFSLPVTSSFLRMDTATDKLVAVPDELLRLRIGPLVAGFLFLSALAHALLASPWLHRWYERSVSRGINPARWVEYSLSSSLMIVVIAMLVGIYDVASLILIFALNATMILFGWLMELHNQTTRRTSSCSLSAPPRSSASSSPSARVHGPAGRCSSTSHSSGSRASATATSPC